MDGLGTQGIGGSGAASLRATSATGSAIIDYGGAGSAQLSNLQADANGIVVQLAIAGSGTSAFGVMSASGFAYLGKLTVGSIIRGEVRYYGVIIRGEVS
jgi:hypothetical protein